MKKLTCSILFIILIFSLSACAKQDDPKYLLVHQYEEFIDYDVSDSTMFDKFINDVSNYTIPGVVVVKVTVRTAFNILVEEREVTGFIYAIYDNSLRVVTSLESVSVSNDGYKVEVSIVDYANRIYTALILTESEEYGIAVIKFDANATVTKLRKIDLAKYTPMNNEPVLMLSNYQKSRNSLIMGTIINKDDELKTYETTLPVDQYIIGGTLINMRRQIVGLVISVDDQDVEIMGIERIREYFNM